MLEESSLPTPFSAGSVSLGGRNQQQWGENQQQQEG